LVTSSVVTVERKVPLKAVGYEVFEFEIEENGSLTLSR